MTGQLIFFAVLAAISVVCAIGMIATENPVRSALNLVLVLFSIALLFIALHATFLAAVQIIVYAGAIMVLFVFVIMLLNAGEEEHTQGSRVSWLLGIPGVLAVTVIVCWALLKSESASVELGGVPQADKAFGGARDLSQLLFHQFLLPFEVTSILVLIAIMGAVVLAAQPESEARRQR